jgi:hypothetical protein
VTALLAGLWGRAAPWLAAAAAILLAVVTLGATQRRAGRAEERARQTAETIKAVEVRHEVEDTVRRDPAGAADRLRGRWSRD